MGVHSAGAVYMLSTIALFFVFKFTKYR